MSSFQSGKKSGKSNEFPFFTFRIGWGECVARKRFPTLLLRVNHMTSVKLQRDRDRAWRVNHPELYDVQEGVVVARRGRQHLGFLSLDADQVLLRDRGNRFRCRELPLGLTLVWLKIISCILNKVPSSWIEFSNAFCESKNKISMFCRAFQVGSHTYNVSPEVNIGELLIDVLDGRLHALIGEEGEPRFWVCAGLWWNESMKGVVAQWVLHPVDIIISPPCEHYSQRCTFSRPAEGPSIFRVAEQIVENENLLPHLPQGDLGWPC